MGTVWSTGGCAGWYLDASGRNTVLWPDFTLWVAQRLPRVPAADYRLATAPSTPGAPAAGRRIAS